MIVDCLFIWIIVEHPHYHHNHYQDKYEREDANNEGECNSTKRYCIR